MSTERENLKFYKGLEKDLPAGSAIEIGALYHCTDTGNTYIGIENNNAKLLNLYSTAFNITGAATTIVNSDLTVSRALISNASGKIAVSATTSTELGYLSGVTSKIQTQLNGKQATITGAATTVTGSNLTVSRALVSNASGKIAVSDITSTELGYLDGVTSNIQT